MGKRSRENSRCDPDFWRPRFFESFAFCWLLLLSLSLGDTSSSTCRTEKLSFGRENLRQNYWNVVLLVWSYFQYSIYGKRPLLKAGPVLWKPMGSQAMQGDTCQSFLKSSLEMCHRPYLQPARVHPRHNGLMHGGQVWSNLVSPKNFCADETADLGGSRLERVEIIYI